MDAYMITFRIIHITSAILWFGSALFYSAFVGPTLGVLGAEGGRAFAHMIRRRKVVVFFLVVATLTVVAGGFLYWRDSGGLDPDFVGTSFGLGLTVGAIGGIIAWLTALLVVAPTSYRLVRLGERVAAAGGPPTQEQLASMQAMQGRVKGFSIVIIVMLTIATLAMATARYLVF